MNLRLSTIKSKYLVRIVWSKIREYRIIKKHAQVSLFWKPIIKSHFINKLPKYLVQGKADINSEKIIWQYWGQGINDPSMPDVVRLCFQSVDKHKGDWKIVRLDDSNYQHYVKFPGEIQRKIDLNILNKTFFSDLLRLALLHLYGGLWLDATIFLTGTPSMKYFKDDYFMFQRDPDEKNKEFWKQSYAYYWNWNKNFKVRVLNSIFYSKKNGVIVSNLLDIMLYYWSEYDRVQDYFFFQILYNDVMSEYLFDYRCEVISDVPPHLLQTIFNTNYPYKNIDDTLSIINMHKMSYFQGDALKEFKKFTQIVNQ